MASDNFRFTTLDIPLYDNGKHVIITYDFQIRIVFHVFIPAHLRVLTVLNYLWI